MSDQYPDWWHRLHAAAETLDDLGATANAVDVRFIADDLQANPAKAVPDGFMLVRKPEWAKAKTEEGEFVCCGGYTPCRGQCAVYAPAAEKGEQHG